MVQTVISADLKRPSELSDAERDAWIEFTDENDGLASPYFRLEFAELCEDVRSDTRVVVARRCGQLVGFLPLQLGKVGYARPLGGPLGDVHGAIVPSNESPDFHDWLRAAGVPLYEYHSALGLQGNWNENATLVDGSWVIDISRGFETFVQERKALEPKAFKNLRMRRRRLEAQDAGFEFIMDDQRPKALTDMIRWKRDQYRKTQVFDVFSVGWTRKLMQKLVHKKSDRFMGLCSTLNIGDEIAAVHVGMASEKLCHYWFPTYDPKFARISPGLLLLLEMAKTAADLGHQGVELGPGEYDFKRHLSSSQIPLAAGCVVTNSAPAMLRSVARQMADTCEKMPLGGLSTAPRRALRKADKIASFYAW